MYNVHRRHAWGMTHDYIIQYLCACSEHADREVIMGKIDESVYMSPGTWVVGDVTIGPETNIWFGAVVRGDYEKISIGKGTSIQDNSVIHISEGFPTTFGDYVTVGHNCTLHGCTVEDYVLCGMGTTIMNGAVIGKNTIIGAGSLITQGTVIPEGSLVIGRPGKVIRPLTDKEKDGIRNSAAAYIANSKRFAAMGIAAPKENIIPVEVIDCRDL